MALPETVTLDIPDIGLPAAFVDRSPVDTTTLDIPDVGLPAAFVGTEAATTTVRNLLLLGVG